MQEWSIQIGQQVLKGYWYSPSSNSPVHQFTDDHSFNLVLVLKGEVYADGIKIEEGFGRLLPALSSEFVHYLYHQAGTECVRLQVPDIAVSNGYSRRPELFFLSSTCLYHLARLLIHVTQVPKGELILHADAILLVRSCLNINDSDLVNDISFDEMYRLVHNLHAMQGKVKAKITVANLAAACQVKTYRLQQICQQAFGLTAHQLLRFMKMHTALKAIGDSSKTLAAIGTGLEYSNDENLINAFRAFYGITPHAARKSLPISHAMPGKL